jgi:hypothetical protein
MAVVILPAGLHELGFAEGTQFVSPASPPAILADDINASTGEVNSLLTSIEPEDSAVIQIMRTRRGSGASVLDIGHRFHLIDKNDERAPSLAEAYARGALADLLRDGRIDLHDIDTSQFGELGDGLGIFLSYSILRTGARRDRVRV